MHQSIPISRRRLGAATLAGLTALLVSPAAGYGATVAGDASGTFFTAAGPETNDVTVQVYEDDAGNFGGSYWTDAGAPLAAGPGCEPLADGVLCPSTHFEVRLGYGDDRFYVADDFLYMLGGTAWGGRGADSLRPGVLAGTFHGEAGNDRVGEGATFNMGSGTFTGGPGHDEITVGETGGSVLSGDEGNDRLTVTWGFSNRMDGGKGDDILSALDQNGGRDAGDFGYGGPGRDVFTGIYWQFISGGTSTDTVDFSAETAPTSIDLTPWPDVEKAIGSPHADTIIGNDLANTLVGNAGGDAISGLGGKDVLQAADGERDDLTCGEARDQAYVDPADVVAADCERRVRPRV